MSEQEWNIANNVSVDHKTLLRSRAPLFTEMMNDNGLYYAIGQGNNNSWWYQRPLKLMETEVDDDCPTCHEYRREREGETA